MVIKLALLCIFLQLESVTSFYSPDASTPIDGNLFQESNDTFKPTKIFIYNNKIILEKNGLALINNRIVKKSLINQVINYSNFDLHKDSNVSFSHDGYMVVLIGNSNRYNHAIFGTENNATGFKVFKGNDIVSIYNLKPDEVIETKRALIADIIPEIKGNEVILTISNKYLGSRVEIFSYKGKSLGSSDSIGQSHRWLHLLAVGPFLNNRDTRLAIVKTPHIGGVLQFFKWNGSKLEKTNELTGMSTHQIGSDNLNMAVAANFDEEDDIELLIPTSDFMAIKIVKYTDQMSTIINTFKLPSRLSTNIFITQDGQKAIWLGTDNGNIVNITE